MSLEVPPFFTNVPAHAMFDLSLPDELLRTLGQFHGLAYQNEGRWTPSATVADFAKLRGIKERQMFNHLKELKKRGLIRVENLGDGRIIIFPLRWQDDRDAALSPERSQVSPEELAVLQDGPTATDCSRTAIQRHEHVHVVVHDSDSVKQQQHVSGAPTAMNCSDQALIEAMAGVFVNADDDGGTARAKAEWLLGAYGSELCARQLGYFERRCEDAKKSREGLKNPAGLLISSIKRNWGPPSNGRPKRSTWISDEEAAIAAQDAVRKLEEMMKENGG